MASVSVFNANTQAVAIEVNNGTKYTVTGAAATTFTPGTLSTSNLTYGTGSPQPDQFGPGVNYITMTPTNSIQTVQFPVNVPTTQQIISLQLYMFWATVNTVNYVLLNNGQLIAQDTVAAKVTTGLGKTAGAGS